MWQLKQLNTKIKPTSEGHSLYKRAVLMCTISGLGVEVIPPLPFKVGPTCHGWRGHEPDQRLGVKEATHQEPREGSVSQSSVPGSCKQWKPHWRLWKQRVRQIKACLLLNEWFMQLPRPSCTEKRGRTYFLVSSSLDRVLMISSFLAWSRSATLRLPWSSGLMASAWSLEKRRWVSCWGHQSWVN